MERAVEEPDQRDNESGPAAHNREGFARAREAAEKALAIDPHHAPAHIRLGSIAMYGDKDLAGAAKHFERALALDPTDLNVLGSVATLLATLGRLDEALAVREAAVHRDSVNVSALFNLGFAQRCAGRYDAAIASFRTALSLRPGRGGARQGLGEALLLKGDASAALAEIEQETSEVWRMVGLPMAYHALGRKADSDAALAALIAKYEKEAAYNIACIYAFRGEADQAFEWLEKELRYGGGMTEVAYEDLFGSIHSDPRWLPLFRRMGMAPDQLTKIDFQGDAAGLSLLDGRPAEAAGVEVFSLTIFLSPPAFEMRRAFREDREETASPKYF